MTNGVFWSDEVKLPAPLIVQSHAVGELVERSAKCKVSPTHNDAGKVKLGLGAITAEAVFFLYQIGEVQIISPSVCVIFA